MYDCYENKFYKRKKFLYLYILILKMPADQIQYSEKYNDDKYEYRFVRKSS